MKAAVASGSSAIARAKPRREAGGFSTLYKKELADHFHSARFKLVFALLILVFTFFYSSISFNPVEIAKNMQQNGGMIPGIRQGKPTSDFILRISRRITLFGALFLAFLAVLPTIIYSIFGINLPFAASSLLIAVSVAMETMRQLESQMTMRHYKGFLN